ncbi:ethylene-responsive transcription factor CRF6-like [Triticum dicoccoides]|uniref:ethylene-responsive transcription factor CRF6-like n=1 Tax=Triticum dicoccoides TaxID=85692 RepID=UPI001890F547|nr:ethylene-responsive transcription factor CRF6-like [Triticum dicoccoides]
MLPCRRETWGYHVVRARPSDGFSAEIRFRGMRLGLGNFNTANEAAHAYDAAAWHLRWPHRTLKFPNVPAWDPTQELAPLLWLSTDEDRHDNRRQEHRLDIAEMDEEAMVLWRQCFPQDIINKREFYVQRRAERAAYPEDKRRQKADTQFNMRLGAASPWESDDDRLLAMAMSHRLK